MGLSDSKYGCALLALVYLVYALLPSSFFANFHAPMVHWAPEWFSRTHSFINFLIFGTIAYGLQKRAPVFWRLIPALIFIFLLMFFISALLTVIEFSWPLLPFLFFMLVVFIGVACLYPQWQKQRGYFRLPQKNSDFV
jgi:hypothetical protein